MWFQKRISKTHKYQVLTKPITLEKIIELVKEQEPERIDIIKSLQNCKEGYWWDRSFFKFVEVYKVEGKENRHYVESLEIDAKEIGYIVLDMLSDGQIGGIEFLNLKDY